MAAGRQAYVVYPLVEESEKLEDVRAATQMAEEWRAALPGGARGPAARPAEERGEGAGDGRLRRGEVHVLVATTVIEVGVDVPNATVMVIEHAERFGLSQLHQLRGRVGRGAGASTCVLVTHGRLSDEARARLDVMTRTGDGFVIAEKDLELRGPGDFFGTRQWGLPRLRVGDLVRDRELLARRATRPSATSRPRGPARRRVRSSSSCTRAAGSGVSAWPGSASGAEIRADRRTMDTAEEPRPIDVPALCDLQVNGFAGVDFNDPSTPPRVVDFAQRNVMRDHRGEALFLPTIVTSTFEHVRGLRAACCC